MKRPDTRSARTAIRFAIGAAMFASTCSIAKAGAQPGMTGGGQVDYNSAKKAATIKIDGVQPGMTGGGHATAAELAEARTSKPDGRYHADPAVATAHAKIASTAATIAAG